MTDKNPKPFTPGCLKWLERDNGDELAAIQETKRRRQEYSKMNMAEKRDRINRDARIINVLILILALIGIVTCIGLIMIYVK